MIALASKEVEALMLDVLKSQWSAHTFVLAEVFSLRHAGVASRDVL